MIEFLLYFPSYSFPAKIPFLIHPKVKKEIWPLAPVSSYPIPFYQRTQKTKSIPHEPIENFAWLTIPWNYCCPTPKNWNQSISTDKKKGNFQKGNLSYLFSVHIPKPASLLIHGLIKLLIQNPHTALVFTVLLKLNSRSHLQFNWSCPLFLSWLKPRNSSIKPNKTPQQLKSNSVQSSARVDVQIHIGVEIHEEKLKTNPPTNWSSDGAYKLYDEYQENPIQNPSNQNQSTTVKNRRSRLRMLSQPPKLN